MSGLGGFAIGAAPVFGGLLLGSQAGRTSTKAKADLRGVIKDELELLERLPQDQVIRRAALKRTIANHLDDLVVANEKALSLKRKTRYLTEVGNWRDLVLFLTAMLFVVIAWYADHHKWHWLPLFVAVSLLAAVTAFFALRGFARSIRTARHEYNRRERL
jgi:hypothetical protein